MFTHLKRLEAEAIHIMREVAAEAENPVMLYSVGKDSAVMLHLGDEGLYPAKPPFPIMHVDTTWKFREMISFRDDLAKKLGLDLIVHINQEGVAQGVGPFYRFGCPHRHHEDRRTKSSLDKHKFDAAFGGARRDEEKSRAKERVFSFRSAQHRWDPKTSGPKSGICTTRASTRASQSASSHSLTGPNSIFGSTSTWRASPLFRCITRRCALS